MKKNNTRWLTILSGVIDILFAIAMCIFSVIGFLASLKVDSKIILATLGTWGIISFIFFSVFVIIGIAFFIAGIILIKLGTKNDLQYSKKKGTIITHVTFDFISIGGLIISSLLVDGFLLIGLILMSVVIISVILKLIDYNIFWRKVNNGKIILNEENPTKNVSENDHNLN